MLPTPGMAPMAPGGAPSAAAPAAPGGKVKIVTRQWFFLGGVHGSLKTTLQGTNISHLWKRKTIFKIAFSMDMLVSGSVPGGVWYKESIGSTLPETNILLMEEIRLTSL